ncbi:hypothetical protein [Mycobacterium sp. DL99]|uniref:hypothetical protein n=1 Tax=Mycobacterium sp. DL99 TaxID=2528957 RepID=UPI001081B4E5|nr:hypothetical protein [Mycobacterium sp. DL99]
MNLALRPYVTAGVALVGASVIAVTPLAPPANTEYLDARLSSAVQNLSTPDSVAPQDAAWAPGTMNAFVQLVEKSFATSSPAAVLEQFTRTQARTETLRDSLANALAVASPQAAGATTAAFPNPLEQWSGIVTEAITNLTLIGQLIASNPAPILQQIVQNQLGYGGTYLAALETVGKNAITLFTPGAPGGVFTNLQRMAEQFAAGNIQAGFSTIQSTMMSLVYQLGIPMLPTLQIPISMARNFANVVEQLPTFAVTAGLGAVSLIGTTIATMGQSGQAIADAVKAGDPVAAVGALISTPGNITQTLVNGWMGFGGGLIGPNGLVTNLLKFRDTVAGALGANGAEAAPAAQQLLSNVGKVVATGTAPALAKALAPKTTVAVSADPAGDRPVTAGAIESDTAITDNTSTPESQLVEHAKAIGTPSVTSAETTKPAVRDSLVAVPGKTGTTPAANKPAARVASDVRDGISATVNKIGEGVKKAFAKPEKKSTSTSAGTDKGAGAGNSGDTK